MKTAQAYKYLLVHILLGSFSSIIYSGQLENVSNKITYWKTVDGYPINYYNCCHPITTWKRNGTDTMLSFRSYNYISDSSYPNFQFDYKVHLYADTLTLIIDKITSLDFVTKTKIAPRAQPTLKLIKADTLEIRLLTNKKIISCPL